MAIHTSRPQPAALADPGVLADYLREIGRGAAGARSLSAERAERFFELLFSGRVAPLETGAALMALRMKGESVVEVTAALSALHRHVLPVVVDGNRPVVSIPSYNGARLTANLTPLLACLLAERGVQVVVHGIRDDPKRLTSYKVFSAMGLLPAQSMDDAQVLLSRRQPAFVPVDVFSPTLYNLLAARSALGVRNIGHTLAKLVNPTSHEDCLRMVSFTHPEFDSLQHELLAASGLPALIMRATEGEAVVNTRRRSRIDFVYQGTCTTLIEPEAVAVAGFPILPPSQDLTATARWTQAVLAGEEPVPQALAAQVDGILQALALVTAPQPAMQGTTQATTHVTNGAPVPSIEERPPLEATPVI